MVKWDTAKLIKSKQLSKNIKSLFFYVASYTPHIPGQYYSIRVTSPEGFVAERDYSISSAPNAEKTVEFGVALIPNGEVSPVLHTLKARDIVNVSGPRGTHFNLDPKSKRPLVMVAGGSGVVPFMSMVRTVAEQGFLTKAILISSFKTEKDILYKNELEKYEKENINFKNIVTLTGHAPLNWKGLTGRLNEVKLSNELNKLAFKSADIYISGGALFVEDMTQNLLKLGVSQENIRIEIFG